MNQMRVCQVQNHNQFSTSICVHTNCQEQVRFLCSTCILQNLHHHNDGNRDNYIIELIDSQKIKQILRQRLIQIEKSLQFQLNYYQHIMHQAMNYIKQSLSSVKEKYQDIQQNHLQLMKNLVNENFLSISYIQQLDNQQLKNLFSLHSSKFQQIVQDDQFEQINYAIQSIQERNIMIQDGLNNNQNQVQQINDLNQIQIPQVQNQNQIYIQQHNIYQFENELNEQVNNLVDSQYQQEIVHRSKSNFHHAEISPNEQYLVFGGRDQIMYVKDLKTKNLSNINVDHYISLFRFSDDSKDLFVGCKNGHLNHYSVERNLELISTRQRHTFWIINMVVVSKYDIIFSSEDEYVKRFYNQQAEMQMSVHLKDQHSIYGLDYIKEKDIIIAAGEGRFINALNGRTGEAIIKVPQAHLGAISQIQLINNQTLITLDVDGKMKWWNLDFVQKNFKEIKSYYDPKNRIFGFYCVMKKKYVLYVGEKSVNIIDRDDQTLIKEIQYTGKELCNIQLYNSKIQINTLSRFAQLYFNPL